MGVIATGKARIKRKKRPGKRRASGTIQPRVKVSESNRNPRTPRTTRGGRPHPSRQGRR